MEIEPNEMVLTVAPYQGARRTWRDTTSHLFDEFLEHFIQVLQRGGEASIGLVHVSPGVKGWMECSSLSVMSDGGRYVLFCKGLSLAHPNVIGMWESDGHCVETKPPVRFTRSGQDDSWPLRNILTDPSVALDAFKEFHSTWRLSEITLAAMYRNWTRKPA